MLLGADPKGRRRCCSAGCGGYDDQADVGAEDDAPEEGRPAARRSSLDEGDDQADIETAKEGEGEASAWPTRSITMPP